ncbi:hypothetical protein [Aliikangiella sp. G2MR2-5]|uniref:hypothetical protein n=1 Tax=Aliikangiella sp. G2MR2-5 TaxID=2788943 RepID=UPI0018ABB17C|nr:hypothetical protein [Aliikangiella sp. G2MR2-5]
MELSYFELLDESAKPKFIANKFLLIALFTSILIHALILQVIGNRKNQSSIQPFTFGQTSFNIEILSEEVKLEKSEKADLSQEITVPQNIKKTGTKIKPLTKPKNNPIDKSEKQTTTSPAHERATSKQSKKPSTPPSFSSIREQVQQLERDGLIELNDSPSSRFDPRLEPHLEKHEQELTRKKDIEEARQFRKDNEFYQFKATGDTQVVRRNGHCFIVPINLGMEPEYRPWVYIGKCGKKKKLDFSRAARDKKAFEKGRDF